MLAKAINIQLKTSFEFEIGETINEASESDTFQSPLSPKNAPAAIYKYNEQVAELNGVIIIIILVVLSPVFP